MTTPPAEPSDEEVLARVAAGDQEALAELFERYADLLFRVVYRILSDRGEAEEVVQEVFLYLFEKPVHFDPAKGAARPWLVTVASRRALDRRTYLSRRGFWSGTSVDLVAESLIGGRDLEEVLTSALSRAQLERALGELPERQRRVLELYFFEALELREISERVGETLANVRHHYYRGLERLRKSSFAREWKDESP